MTTAAVFRRLLCAAGALPLALLPFSAPLGATEVVLQDGAWTLSCDAEAQCTAETFVSVGERDYLRLALERPLAPAADMVLEFQSSLTPPVGGKVRLWVPSQDYRMVGDITREPDEGKVRFGGIVPDEPMMRALKAGDAATAVLELASGTKVEIPVPLDGFTPVLALMDDHQGRVGRQDALIISGPRPADSGSFQLALRPGGTETIQSSVSDDRRVRIIERRAVTDLAEVPDRVREAATSDPVCPLSDTLPALGATYYGINETSGIWELPCFLGAYQGTSVYVYSVLIDGDLNAALLHFQGPPTGEPTEDPEIISPSFDPATSVLTSFARARGIGDCGRLVTYELVYLEGESIGWEALTLREKKDCNGVDDAPESYPLIWSRDG
ncbi:DUF1176 domain-containing protein [Microvirga tunisiensis]|uniref:DUF1176 domain-containing protein n=2 Tax=Pannonibacter tanglangensis TaxID=2750084 RepID=A0ABW9ZBG6_9HYPH|nr:MULTISPECIES: DUF1176 domain-containing protein [unclassified Pannonibacter]NBN62164.1 DUF1176 domain-containing protein [Pannonibacter sp. XCT-34]NBN77832.1 DUF1176 domain-containing protein [Pannonibacter sp. XCT-53]